jgi:hypothetical protein
MLLGSRILDENEVLTLNYSMTYMLSCVAQNSRPNVNVNIIDGKNNVSIEKYYGVSGIYRSSQCDSSTFCASLIYLTLSLNDTMYLSLKSLICKAENTTEPYALSTSLKISVIVNNMTESKNSK